MARVRAAEAAWSRRRALRRAVSQAAARGGSGQYRQEVPPSVPRTATLAVVYRHNNASTVEAFLGQENLGWCDIRLWALDDVHPRLERLTVGQGPGMKWELLNRVLDPVDQLPGHVIIADDDIVLQRGSLRELVEAGDRAGFGLFQASHARSSCVTYPMTSRRWLARARDSTFVEIGPLFVIGAGWRQRFLPFPAGIGMGWGLEFDWTQARQSGCRLGIVDDVSVVHLVPAGALYSGKDDEYARLDRVMAEASVNSLSDIQQVLGTWWRWQPSPPWSAYGPRSGKV